MWKKELSRLWLAVRGGVALGLTLVAVWFLGLTTGSGYVQDKLTRLSRLPGLGVGILEAESGLSRRALSGSALTGWAELVVCQSPWLRGEGLWLPEEESGLPAQPPEDPESGEISLTAPQQTHTDVLEMTCTTSDSGDSLTHEGVCLLNKSGLALTGAQLSAPSPVPQFQDGPQILILHTHGSEAYTQTGADTYEESDPYRTTDCTQNVVRVGEEMAMELRAHGFRVLHDTNLYDYPSYNGAYERSGAAVEQWLAQYPGIQVILDVHRDALVGAGEQPYALVSTEAGEKVAQVMLVVGSDGGGSDHPNWEENLAFAAHLQRGVVKSCTSLARPMVLRGSRFNQQYTPFSLLVEVGGHGNTLSQAMAAGRLWADSVARTLKGMCS